MAVYISRHEIRNAPTAAGLEIVGEDASEAIDSLEDSPRVFSQAMSASLTVALGRCYGDPDARDLETWEAYVVSMQVASALFDTVQADDGMVECRIDHKIRTIPALEVNHSSNAGSWISAFWLALICRDRDRAEALCRVPISLLRAAGAEFDEYVYDWVDSLQTYWLLRPGLVGKLTATIEGTHTEVARIAGRELMTRILYHPINLFHRYLREDHVGFNEALAQALEMHKEYWSANDQRAGDPTGFVALGPLAIASLAYDAGFPVEVESEYLPRCLLERSWYGEFPT